MEPVGEQTPPDSLTLGESWPQDSADTLRAVLALGECLTLGQC